MATPTAYDKRLIAVFIIDAINNSDLSNPTITAWTTAAQFKAAIENQPFKTFSQKQDYQAYGRNIQAGIDAGILTDANVNAASSKATLVDIAQAFITDTPDNHQGGSHWWA